MEPAITSIQPACVARGFSFRAGASFSSGSALRIIFGIVLIYLKKALRRHKMSRQSKSNREIYQSETKLPSLLCVSRTISVTLWCKPEQEHSPQRHGDIHRDTVSS